MVHRQNLMIVWLIWLIILKLALLAEWYMWDVHVKLRCLHRSGVLAKMKATIAEQWSTWNLIEVDVMILYSVYTCILTVYIYIYKYIYYYIFLHYIYLRSPTTDHFGSFNVWYVQRDDWPGRWCYTFNFELFLDNFGNWEYHLFWDYPDQKQATCYVGLT